MLVRCLQITMIAIIVNVPATNGVVVNIKITLAQDTAMIEDKDTIFVRYQSAKKIKIGKIKPEK